MRSSIAVEFVLDILQAGTRTSAVLFDAMTSDYTSSRRKLAKAAYRTSFTASPRWADIYRDRQKFYHLLNHLKRQGFVEAKKRNGTSLWALTQKGKKKLAIAKEQNAYSAAQARTYTAGSDASVRLIMYDIPASEARKRHWLRFALQSMGFTLLQKSVWMGKKKIPERFLKDLNEKHMLKYVHIIEIARGGTIEKIA
jgi:hypothetical protein